jgi:Fe-S oxidoreductase
MHSTRGRARLLFEMLQGNPLKDGWRDAHVREALDLCLACKGCKGDCPLQVDMATYKAEFLSHYYQGRLRPRHAFSMGLIYWWARAAALMPTIVNSVMQMPLLSAAIKSLGGIAPQREVPTFAAQTFKQWFNARGARNAGKAKVILWPDTFNNHFFPEVGRAAVEVLEAAGFQVLVPEPSLCCGRPLYDFGMLDTAKHLLRQILDALRPHIQLGIPVIGLEPSCISVFRDELTGLFPNDEDAKRLRDHSYLLTEFLHHFAEDYQPPQLMRKAVVHGHCHRKAIMGLEDEKDIFSKLGLDYEMLDSGCCGMAGSFGFEKEHYDVSMKVADLALLPAVRQASKETLIIADGFSCREQIRQATDREALHPAQVLQLALRQNRAEIAMTYPESIFVEQRERDRENAKRNAAVLFGAAALLLFALLQNKKARLG